METFKKMPKIDLHCHLDGSLSIETIRDLSKEAGISVPESDDELKKLLVAPENCGSLKEYLEKFSLPISLLNIKQNLRKASYSVVEAAAKENVTYIEIRFAPLSFTNKGLKVFEIIEEVILGMKKAEEDFNINANIIVCGMRHEPVEKNIEMLKAAREFLGYGLCAIDIAGNELEFPTYTQRDLFIEAKKLDMPFTIHAGECENSQNVIDAVELGAKRIGHGIAIKDNEEARKLCLNRGIGLELCPTSNMQTKAIASWAEYPIRMFMDEGLKVTVNTDNRMVSDTNLTNEFTKLNKYFGIGEEEIRKIYLNSIDCAFASDEVKQILYKKMIDVSQYKQL